MRELGVIDIKKDGVKQAIGNSQTAVVVSDVLRLTGEQAKFFLYQVDASGVSGTAAVVKLQDSIDGTNFADVGSPAQVTVNANGRFRDKLNNGVSTDAAVMPLGPYVRFVATTGASDALTIDAIRVVLF